MTKRSRSTFEQIVKEALTSIGASLGLPPEHALKNVSRTNYSSSRVAILEVRRFESRRFKGWPS